MPSAPGARPRKMLPPPITTPISTPRRETCATSETMLRIVCRLMPYGSSPIRASPESLSRIRLYLGVTARRHDGVFLVNLRRFLDALTNDEEGVSVDLALLRREHFLHRLLVVLDERLAEQRDLAEELVHGSLHHLAGDLFRLALLLCPGELDLPLPCNHLSRHLGFGHVLRLGEGDVHRDVLADLVGAVIVDQHADLDAVQVEGKFALRLQALEAPDRHVLADLLDQGLPALLDLAGGQCREVLWVLRRDGFRQPARRACRPRKRTRRSRLRPRRGSRPCSPWRRS